MPSKYHYIVQTYDSVGTEEFDADSCDVSDSGVLVFQRDGEVFKAWTVDCWWAVDREDNDNAE
jgi:hypothetical protein